MHEEKHKGFIRSKKVQFLSFLEEFNYFPPPNEMATVRRPAE